LALAIAGNADGVVHDSAIGHAVSQGLQSVGVNESIANGVGTLVPMLMGGLNPFRGCFAAGTKIWSPEGYRRIEDFKVGDLVYARNEFDPNGPIEAKPIEELFRNVAEVFHLHVEDQVIRTTEDHPFFARDKGWVGPRDLEIGDEILADENRWLTVSDLLATGEYESVYNFRVADHHTYFVGDESWGWRVWSHNDCHHIVSVYSNLNRRFAKPWTVMSQGILNRAGIGLGSRVNKINLRIHKGPHPELYHQRVYERLAKAGRGLSGEKFQTAILGELDTIASELARYPSRLSGIGL
jgi:hypothetical protein